MRELLDQAEIRLLYLPRYSPEFNPIEPALPRMKGRIEAKAAPSLETLDTITANDA